MHALMLPIDVTLVTAGSGLFSLSGVGTHHRGY